MSVRTFSCSNCNEPFHLHLPEDTTKADFSKCEDKYTFITIYNTQSNAKIVSARNTIYYSIDGHPMLMTED